MERSTIAIVLPGWGVPSAASVIWLDILART
jgi:hypothetical protein